MRRNELANLTDRLVCIYSGRMVNQRNLQAEDTRKKIMLAAAEEIYRVGFQSASVGEILRRLEISKGCFYHHFSTKQELGYAVLEEYFVQFQAEIWDPVFNAANPLRAVIILLGNTNNFINRERIKLGCPINNIAQEMSPIDEGFRTRVENIYRMLRTRLTKALLQAQKQGQMRGDANVRELAVLIITVMQGAVGMAKNAQDHTMFTECTSGLRRYLKSLEN